MEMIDDRGGLYYNEGTVKQYCLSEIIGWINKGGFGDGP